jgi:putative oxidoreductase
MLQLFKPSRVSAPVSFALLFLRFVAGLAFVYHGYGKITNPFGWMGPNSGYPAFLQALAALAEFGGGLAWIAGLLTPLASFGLLCTMVVAARMHALVLGDPFVSMTGGRSYELAAVYLAISVLLLLAGPGRFSADRALFGEKA